MAELDSDLREQVVAFAAGELSVDGLRSWAAMMSADPGALSDPSREVLYDIELRLAEFSNDDWTEEELRQKLSIHAREYHVVDRIAFEAAAGSSASSSMVGLSFPIPGRQPASGDTQVVVVSV